jgi:D-xylonolactonase
MTDEAGFEMLVDGFQFVEALRVADDGRLFFSDLVGGGYHCRHPDGRVATILPDRLWIGGAIPCDDGGFICSGKGGLVRMPPGDATPVPLLTEMHGRPIVAINDIEPDEKGGLFGGTVDFAALFERGEAPAEGSFFHMDRYGEVRILREGVAISNGMDMSPDGKRLYHNESTVGLWAYDLDDAGLPADARLLMKLDDCDGLVVDAEEGIWVALWREARLLRILPDGSLDREIATPFHNAVTLSFGGPDLRYLHIGTGAAPERPNSGGVARMRVPVPGRPPRKCAIGTPG